MPSDILDNTLVQILLTILAIAAAQLFIHNTLGHIVERVVRGHRYATKTEEHQREKTLKTIFRTTSGVVLWTIGAIIILWELHINIAALLTGAGLISIVAGLGAQSLIKDWLAGIFIIMENQYRVDDIITLTASNGATVSGVVEDVSVRLTRLRDMDGNLHIITNGSINIISNQSYRFANVNVDIQVTYDTDIDLVEKLVNQAGVAVAGQDKWKEQVIEAIQFLRVDKLGESSVTIKALGKVRAGSQWDIAGAFRRELQTSFKKHHIAAPYPQIVLHESKK